jgi:hypothetical protein
MNVVDQVSKALFCVISAVVPAAATSGLYVGYYFIAYADTPNLIWVIICGIPSAIAGVMGALYVIRKTNSTVIHIINVTSLILVTIYVGYLFLLSRIAARALQNGEHMPPLF